MAYIPGSIKTRRQFRQDELNTLNSFALAEMARFGMAWRAVVKRDGQDKGHEEQVTARVSPSRVSRKSRELLGLYPLDAARAHMAEWVEELAGEEEISYRRRSSFPVGVVRST